jgi:S1-C subfamily serine protease
LKAGDLILGVDGAGINTAAEFESIIASHVSGDTITLNIQRDDKQQAIKAVLGANPFLS